MVPGWYFKVKTCEFSEIWIIHSLKLWDHSYIYIQFTAEHSEFSKFKVWVWHTPPCIVIYSDLIDCHYSFCIWKSEWKQVINTIYFFYYWFSISFNVYIAIYTVIVLTYKSHKKSLSGSRKTVYIKDCIFYDFFHILHWLRFLFCCRSENGRNNLFKTFSLQERH